LPLQNICHRYVNKTKTLPDLGPAIYRELKQMPEF